MYEARQNKEKVSRRIDYNRVGQKKKKWQNQIVCKIPHPHICQFARVANITCPNWGDNASLGNAIHVFIQSRFLANNTSNRARVEIPHSTPYPHKHDIGDNNNGIYRYGEIKPNTQNEINAGVRQIQHHPLRQRISVNNVANLQFLLSNTIDPQASIPGKQNPVLRVQQHQPGLLVYDGQ